MYSGFPNVTALHTCQSWSQEFCIGNCSFKGLRWCGLFQAGQRQLAWWDVRAQEGCT